MKQSKFFLLSFLALYLINYSVEVSGQPIVISPDKATGIYKVGETVTWTIQSNPDSDIQLISYKVKRGELTKVDGGNLMLTNGIAKIQYTFHSPGSALVEINWNPDANRKNRAVGGAIASPDEITLSSNKPGDFDSFWNSKIIELKSTPANPRLDKVESVKTGIDYWKITMDNIRGSHIQGQLARPSSGGKFPALLIVQWAGVYPLQKDWVVSRAESGWLVLNIEAHDLPIDEPAEFYKDQFEGPLNNYWTIGNNDKDSSYFLRMYLSCYRAAQYLTERKDWNGQTLVVMGDSQGGLQALMTAGFHPSITAAIALVPAGFDMLGPNVGRKGGWPQWYDCTEGKDSAKVHEASRYYDVANFVTRIKCPVLVGVGLIDETCPPEGILAGLNQLKTPKELIILPQSGHQDIHGSQEAFRNERDKVWLPALQKGEMVPVTDIGN